MGFEPGSENKTSAFVNKIHKIHKINTVVQCGVLYSSLTFQQVDRSGKLGYEEFKKLWNDLRLWKVCQYSLKYFMLFVGVPGILNS